MKKEVMGNYFTVYDKKKKGKTYLANFIECPTGSIKDKVYIYILKNALKNNKQLKKQVIVEILSGDDAISFAYACATLKIKCIIITYISDPSIEFIRLFNANVVFSTYDDFEKNQEILKTLLQENANYITLNLYNSIQQEKYHEEITAKLLVESINGNIDMIIIPIESGALAMGIAEYVKFFNEYVEIVGVTINNSKTTLSIIYDDYNLDKLFEFNREDVEEFSRGMLKMGNAYGLYSAAAIKAYHDLKSKDKIKNKNIVIICPDTFLKYINSKNL